MIVMAAARLVMILVIVVVMMLVRMLVLMVMMVVMGLLVLQRGQLQGQGLGLLDGLLHLDARQLVHGVVMMVAESLWLRSIATTSWISSSVISSVRLRTMQDAVSIWFS